MPRMNPSKAAGAWFGRQLDAVFTRRLVRIYQRVVDVSEPRSQ